MSEAPAVVDDRSGAAPATWRFFTDAVMGGVSSGQLRAEPVAGRAALCLRGRVSLANRGGFIQMALDVRVPAGFAWRGIELDVRGNDRRYNLHLRTVQGHRWVVSDASQLFGRRNAPSGRDSIGANTCS